MSPRKPAPGPKPKTVLIVEDDASMLEYFERVVRDAGFASLTLTDGLSVLELMRRGRPDAVILDLMLPKYGGLELLKELGRGPTASIPLIIATARFTNEPERSFIVRQPNVAAFFEKPVDATELKDALARVRGGGS